MNSNTINGRILINLMKVRDSRLALLFGPVQLFCDLMDCGLPHPCAFCIAGRFYTAEPPGKSPINGRILIKMMETRDSRIAYNRNGIQNGAKYCQLVNLLDYNN